MTKEPTSKTFKCTDGTWVKLFLKTLCDSGPRNSAFHTNNAESLIHRIFRKYMTKSTPHIVPLIRYNKKHRYLQMQYAKHSTVFHYTLSDRAFKYFYFQIVWTLYAIQSKYPSFRHNDLHLNNILVHYTTNEKLTYFDCNHQVAFTLKTNEYYGKIAWISDFDLSSIRGVVENYKVADIQFTNPNIGCGSNTDHRVDLFKISAQFYHFSERQATQKLRNDLNQLFGGNLATAAGKNHYGAKYEHLSCNLPTPEQLLFETSFFNEFKTGEIDADYIVQLPKKFYRFKVLPKTKVEERWVPYILKDPPATHSQQYFQSLDENFDPDYFGPIVDVNSAPIRPMLNYLYSMHKPQNHAHVNEYTISTLHRLSSKLRIPEKCYFLVVLSIYAYAVSQTPGIAEGYAFDGRLWWLDFLPKSWKITVHHLVQIKMQINWLL